MSAKAKSSLAVLVAFVRFVVRLGVAFNHLAPRIIWTSEKARIAGREVVATVRRQHHDSRHRDRIQVVVNESAEREAIARDRPLGDRSVVSDNDVMEHMARNLGRQDAAELAMAVVEREAQTTTRRQSRGMRM